MPNVQVLSFWTELFKRLIGETHVFGTTFIFLYFPLEKWSFKIVPTRGRPVSVIDHIRAGRDFVKFEHVKISLIDSGFAKLQQF